MHAESRLLTVPTRPTMPIALMRTAGLLPVVEFLGRRRAPVEALLARAHLSPHLLDHPEGLLPVSQVARFMEDAAAETGLAQLGLLAGAEVRIDGLGIFGRIIRSARTLGDAIQTLTAAAPAFASGSRFWLSRHGECARLCHSFGEPHGAPTTYRQADRYWLMLMLEVVRLGAGPGWRPAAVSLETSAAGGIPAGIFDAARIAFEQRETAVTFPTMLLSRPLPPSRITAVETADVERWHAGAPPDDFVASVLQVVSTLSTPEYPRLDVVAAAIGVGIRNLQRRLADVGETFERVVARARLGTAAHLLASTNASVLDIALDVGYSDHAHFTRAFRRWTGVPPREFRKSRRRRDANGLGRDSERSSPAYLPVGSSSVTTNRSPHAGPSGGASA